MDRSVIIIGCIVLVAIAAYALLGSETQTNVETSNPNLNWNTDLNSALSEAKATNKPLFIDFYATWCSYCKKLDENTFSDNRVQQKLNSKYVLVKIDTDKNKDITSKYKIYGFPTMVLLDPNGNEIKRIEGYVDADTLLNQI